MHFFFFFKYSNSTLASLNVGTAPGEIIQQYLEKVISLLNVTLKHVLDARNVGPSR